MNKVYPWEKAVGREKRPVAFFVLLLFICFALFSSCASHLREAKLHYTQGQEYSRLYQTEEALGSFKNALQEAERVVSKHPSSQAYMLKGMAELTIPMGLKKARNGLSRSLFWAWLSRWRSSGSRSHRSGSTFSLSKNPSFHPLPSWLPRDTRMRC